MMPATLSSRVLLRGIELSGYRSFGQAPQTIGPLREINLLAGRNNAGKSNVIRFIKNYLRPSFPATNDLDTPQGEAELAPRMSLPITMPEREITEYARASRSINYEDVKAYLEEVLRKSAFRRPPDDLIWLPFIAVDHGNGTSAWTLDPEAGRLALEGTRNDYFLQELSGQFNGMTSTPEENALRILAKFAPRLDELPPVEFIEAFRQILPDPETNNMHNGRGLVRALARLQSPTIDRYQHDKARFGQINDFIRFVLADSTAQLEISHDESQLLVKRTSRTGAEIILPIENLGSGIHQVVLLAAAATVIDKKLVCIEEPELHLHPILQRKLIHYLASTTTNQYIIATHSAAMLDYDRAALFHVTAPDDQSLVQAIGSPDQVADICSDLGYRPSDLIQTNSIIWVEGPSDRVYLRHWISLLAPELAEGVHYSLMFYGGRLLSHLTPNDPDVEKFISLRRINRNTTILIDSDRDSSETLLNSTKRRVIEEFGSNEARGFPWVTWGRMIENYAPQDVFNRRIQELAKDPEINWNGERYSNPFRGLSSPDKVGLSHSICAEWTTISDSAESDLYRQVAKVVEFVRRSNAMD